MELSNINKTMSEEIFGGELDVTEETPDSFETDKSQVRQYRDWLHERHEKQLEILKKVESALQKMENFSRTKKDMHLPVRDGIQEAKKELGALQYDIEDTVCYLDSFEYLMRGLIVRKMKEVRPSKQKEVADKGSQTLPQPAARSTPDTRKWPRESTASPEVSAAKKPAERGLKPPIKKKSGSRSPRRRTSGKGKGRSLPNRRRNLAMRAQKRCSSNRQRG